MKKMIVGQMSLFRFPMWKECLASLASHVDALYLRLDNNGNMAMIGEIPLVCGEKIKGLKISTIDWNTYNWREEMLRMLDNVKPEIVITCDEDEIFGEGLEEDVERLRKSKYSQMAFNYEYPMPTEDGYAYKDKPLPSKPHVKMFKWKKGLTFIPYKGRARLSNYDKTDYMLAQTKILHYCFYNEEIRKIKLINTKAKLDWLKGTKNEKARI